MELDSNVRAVAIIGAGTIARTVGAELAAGAVPGLGLHGFLTREPRPGLPGPELAELPGRGAVVVEAASHQAVHELGAQVLASGADLICMSVGALADHELRERLAGAAAAGGSRLIVPSGAIAGLDLLRAAAESGLDEVVIEQRKPPRALLPEDEADELTEAHVVFDGPVSGVVVAYPKTTNVAAAVALAGLGFDRTRAVVVADPSLSANRALLTARGGFGTLTLQLDNVASANPRTSSIVAYSVLATLRGLVEPLVVG
ncbi:MAG TPA: aspartate dehydrogenase domain-containing protein [Gaiellaceae bacterium]|jgi:aspartate dehydrogenase|nr:aspartate dehydrogenase domain-containing protein [Gaiellaceae bacterium]